MIKTLENFSKKSFDNYTLNPECEFSEKNIFFGYNGRGKSSLAFGIYEEFLKDKEDKLCRFFNRDYIKNGLLLSEDDRSNLKGVKATFGKRDVDIVKRIDELNSQLVDTSEEYKNVESDRVKLREQIDKCHDDYKGQAKVNKKNNGLKLENVLSQYSSDLNAALDIIEENQLRTYDLNKTNVDNNYQTIVNLSLPDLNINKLTSHQKSFLSRSLEKNYDVDNDISNDVLNWVEEGLNLHDGEDCVCKFCHNNADINTIRENFKRIKSRELQKDVDELISIKSVLEKNKSLIDNSIEHTSYQNILNIEGEVKQKINSKLSSSIYIDLINLINRKIENMNTSLYADMDNLNELEDQVLKINDYINDCRLKKLNIENDLLNNYNKLAKGKIALAIKNYNIQGKLKEIQDREKELQSIDMRNSQVNSEISELNNSLSEYSEFMLFINQILDNLNMKFKLYLDDDKKSYYLAFGDLDNTYLTIDDISEGEKNLLALLFFYFELYEDDQLNIIKKDIELIIIDDPISSLDDQNKFYVLELLRNILNMKNSQIFIFTHSWDDFCNLTYSNKQSYKLFEIYKDQGSKVRLIENNVEPYRKLFIDIYLISKKNKEDLNDDDKYNSPNSMRRIFEEYLKFKSPNSALAQKSEQLNIEDLYEKATGKAISRNKKIKLGEFLSFINVLSHKPYRSEEVVRNAKFLMKFIEDMDKVHYKSMIHNVG